MSTLGRRGHRACSTDKVVIEPGQMKLLLRASKARSALHYNGESHILEAGDSAYLDGGTPHGWENREPGRPRSSG